MSIFRADILSHTLGMTTGVNVILPDDLSKKNAELPVVYLLHGLSDNSSAWLCNTSVGRYCVEYGVALVMPEVQRSFYLDMKYGLRYFSYITDELPMLMQHFFGLGNRREQTYVAGLSMGGFGALKCALTYPERYAGCGAFSAASWLGEEDFMKIVPPEILGEVVGALGLEGYLPPNERLSVLVEKAGEWKQRPRFYLTCGLQDELLPGNRLMRDRLQAQSLDVTYEEWEGGHQWLLWDRSLQNFLTHFFG